MKLLLPPIPARWAEALEADRGYIAGGCLRDLIIGVPPKDVDIFTDEVDLRNMQRLGDVSKGVFEFEGDYQNALEVWNIGPPLSSSTSLQVIVNYDEHLDPREAIDRFDIGLCRVAWDLKGWVVHSYFIEDLEEETFRVRSDRTPASTRRRMKRFRRRYPDFYFDIDLTGRLSRVKKRPLVVVNCRSCGVRWSTWRHVV